MFNHDPEIRLERYEQEYANDPEFVAEELAIKVTEEMLECLEQRNLSQSWLAEQMGVSRAHVSRILNARPNMTLLTIAKIAVALGVKPDVCLDSWSFSWVEPVSTVPLIPLTEFPTKANSPDAAGDIGLDYSPSTEPITA